MINTPSSRLTALALIAAFGAAAAPVLAQDNNSEAPAESASSDSGQTTNTVVGDTSAAAKDIVDSATEMTQNAVDSTETAVQAVKDGMENMVSDDAETEADTPTDDAKSEDDATTEAGQPDQQALGQPYVAEVTGDWQIECLRTTLEADPCRLVQILLDQGNPTVRVEVVALPEGSPAPAVATFYSPLETLLSEQLALSVDGGPQSKHMFNYCTPQFCIAQVPFASNAVTAFKRGNVAEAAIVPLQAPDQQAKLKMSLTGFTAGYDRLTELSKASAAAMKKAAAERQQ